MQEEARCTFGPRCPVSHLLLVRHSLEAFGKSTANGFPWSLQTMLCCQHSSGHLSADQPPCLLLLSSAPHHHPHSVRVKKNDGNQPRRKGKISSLFSSKQPSLGWLLAGAHGESCWRIMELKVAERGANSPSSKRHSYLDVTFDAAAAA